MLIKFLLWLFPDLDYCNDEIVVDETAGGAVDHMGFIKR